MKTVQFRMMDLNARQLSREQMKQITGGGAATVICYKCCPDDKCASKPHACPESCGPIKD